MSDEMKCFEMLRSIKKYFSIGYKNLQKFKYLVSLRLSAKFGDGCFG